MHVVTEHCLPTPERRDEFPIGSFRYLETVLQAIRSRIMARATELADHDNPTHPIYRVTRHHIDRALRELLSDPQDLRNTAGV
jgi:hypothetical protein